MTRTRFADNLSRRLNLLPGELPLLLAAAGALFFIGSGNVLFNNVAETTFLKRFGVHYLPAMILVNALATVGVMALVGRWLSRSSGQAVLVRVLVLCALAAAGVRLLVPLDLWLLYPVIYLFKALFELLLTFLFWNLANQIFTTRQSKRFFPLMVPAGILGGLTGGYATPLLARLVSVDGLLWVYAGSVLVAALLVRRTARLAQGHQAEPEFCQLESKSGFFGSLKRAWPVLKASSLVRGLVLLTLIPNMIVPILNYQVSFAIDMSHGSEASMVAFFGFYRGAQFTLALLVSLFASRIYRRFGVAGGLLVHPVNYLLIFVAFAMQFDLVTAVYAGISSGVIRRAIQTPARAALVGLFPNQQRVLLMPLLRGVVVRLGVLVGAVFVIVCQSGYFAACRFPLHPQNLAPFGFLFALVWLWVGLRMKRHYPELVLETLGWNGTQRGRLRLASAEAARLRTEVTRGRTRLSQAQTLLRHFHTDEARELAALLRQQAHEAGMDVLGRLEESDPSGRIRTIRQTIVHGDSRHRANAIEALEQLAPHGVATGLVQCLDGQIQGGWHHRHDHLLDELCADGDPEIARLAARLQVEEKRAANL